MTPRRRFPPPWQMTWTGQGWTVSDSTGCVLAHVHGRDPPPGHEDATCLTLDESRRIAAGIARLPELMQQKSVADALAALRFEAEEKRRRQRR